MSRLQIQRTWSESIQMGFVAKCKYSIDLSETWLFFIYLLFINDAIQDYHSTGFYGSVLHSPYQVWWQLFTMEGGYLRQQAAKSSYKKVPYWFMRGSQHPQSAYVGLNDSRQLPGTYVKTQYGYSQESLPT